MRYLTLSAVCASALVLNLAHADELILPQAQPRATIPHSDIRADEAPTPKQADKIEPTEWVSDDVTDETQSDADVDVDADTDTETSAPLTPTDDEATDDSAPITANAKPVEIVLPKKGQSMKDVLKAYGEPNKKHAPVGGDSPRHPAITRWDYAQFSVFFEKDRVINSVNPQQPPALQHTDKLKPLEY